MSTNNGNTVEPRTALGLAREQRLRDAAEAMREYEAEALAIQAKTERLRALRLAKEAANPPTQTAARQKRQNR